MAKLDQEKTCHLHYAADMIRGITDGLIKMDRVHACRGFVTAANLSSRVSLDPSPRDDPCLYTPDVQLKSLHISRKKG